MRDHHDQASGSHAPPSDVLSDVLRTVRLTGALFFLVEASAPWVMELPDGATLAPSLPSGAQNVISYHIVTRGTCWGRLAGRQAVQLSAGDVLVFPWGDAYAMAMSPDMRGGPSLAEIMAFMRAMAAGQLPFVITEGGGGADRLDLVCGFLGCDMRPFNPLLDALPAFLHLPRTSHAGSDPLSRLIDFAIAESRERRPGGECVRLRLSELMFVEVVRRYLTTLPAEERGWLAALRDPVVGRGLTLMHQRPAEAWTLDRLATDAGTSRSVLTERFTQFVGQPPMHYLTHWRLQLAARLLADGAAKVSAVALDVGYESEAAFSRAFKRLTGVAPAVWRSRHVTAAAAHGASASTTSSSTAAASNARV